MKDDSRKVAKHQKRAGNPEFSEYRRKAGVFRSFSEAFSGENYMN